MVYRLLGLRQFTEISAALWTPSAPPFLRAVSRRIYDLASAESFLLPEIDKFVAGKYRWPGVDGFTPAISIAFTGRYGGQYWAWFGVVLQLRLKNGKSPGIALAMVAGFAS